VGPRIVLDTVVKRKIPSPHRESNPRTPIVQQFHYFKNVYFKKNKSEELTGWMIGGLNPGRGWKFFSPPHPDGLWVPPSFLSDGYQGDFPWA
jgi:hypothetical protein